MAKEEYEKPEVLDTEKDENAISWNGNEFSCGGGNTFINIGDKAIEKVRPNGCGCGGGSGFLPDDERDSDDTQKSKKDSKPETKE